MEKAIVRVLTPKKSTDILREIMAAKSRGRCGRRSHTVLTLTINPDPQPRTLTPNAVTHFPVNLYSAMRWLTASECPLSGAYGKPGDLFVLIEASSAHGTRMFKKLDI